MKRIVTQYVCDCCKEVIKDGEDIKALKVGTIEGEDIFVPDQGEEIHHYHDYCLMNFLTSDTKKNRLTTAG